MSSNQEVEVRKTEVMAAFENLVAVSKSMDLDGYFAILDRREFTSLNHDGTVTLAFEEFESTYREQVKYVARYRDLEFRNVKVSVLAADVCLLVNEYRAVVELTGGDTAEMEGAGTQVWRKRPEGWLLSHISSSMKAPS